GRVPVLPRGHRGTRAGGPSGGCAGRSARTAAGGAAGRGKPRRARQNGPRQRRAARQVAIRRDARWRRCRTGPPHQRHDEPAAAEHGATWYSAVPTMHQMLLLRNRGERPAGAEKLRFIRSSSSSLSPETMRQLEARFGAPVVEAYGMTEASHQMASNPLPPRDRRPGTVGVETGIRIAVMDETGALLATGVPGEVVIQGRS